MVNIISVLCTLFVALQAVLGVIDSNNYRVQREEEMENGAYNFYAFCPQRVPWYSSIVLPSLLTSHFLKNEEQKSAFDSPQFFGFLLIPL